MPKAVQFEKYSNPTGSKLEPLKGDGKVFKVGGKFLDIGIPNQDGLTFTDETINALLNDERTKDCLKRRVFPAYIEHPKVNEPGFKRTEAGVLIKLERRGNELYGEIELLDTDEGLYIRNLYEHGVQIGVSIRSDGYTDTGTIPGRTVGPVQFYGFDFVAEPAYKYAVPQRLAASRQKPRIQLNGSRCDEAYLSRLRYAALGNLCKNLCKKEN